ncbi:MAG TPA: twin-arginine translocase subunit TatC [Candidatus Thermoplasmatota archaeon]|nr:twin-arginine translocase subunit TatC [Candidatus Thermoplasmatota archaeon]
MFVALALVVNVAAGRLLHVARARPGQDLGLLDHLRELRGRFLSVLAAVAVLAFVFFGFGLRLVADRFWIPWPSAHDSVAAAVFRAMAERFTPAGVDLVVTSPLDGVVALVWVALALTAAAASPILAWHTASFLGPAMRANEKRAVLVAVPLGVGLFLAGAAFAWFLLVPTIFATLYTYAGALDAQLLLAVPELVSFAAILLLVFGLSFELPVVMAAVSRVGLVKPRTWWRGWRHAILAIVVVAAVVTPDPTVVSQMFVAVPLLGLYVLGATMASLLGRRAPSD